MGLGQNDMKWERKRERERERERDEERREIIRYSETKFCKSKIPLLIPKLVNFSCTLCWLSFFTPNLPFSIVQVNFPFIKEKRKKKHNFGARRVLSTYIKEKGIGINVEALIAFFFLSFWGNPNPNPNLKKREKWPQLYLCLKTKF